MKLDEDYEDVEQNTYSGAGNSRLMSWLVLAVAVGGFAALAYYAYRSGDRATTEGDLVTIEAESGPIKEAPVDAEGEEFANKDKTIYNVIDETAGPAKTEKLMPEPERPVAAADHEDEDSIAAALEPVAAPVAAKPAEVAMPKPMEAVAVEVKTSATEPKTEVESTTTYVAEPADVQASFDAPRIINEKPVKGKPAKSVAPKIVKIEPEVPEAEPEVKEVSQAAEPAVEPEPKPAAPSARGGAYKVQLGAFKSEAEAQASWKKISAKYAGVVSGAPTIMRADLPKGTFYRLRAGSFADSAEAKAACARMAGQPCMPVK